MNNFLERNKIDKSLPRLTKKKKKKKEDLKIEIIMERDIKTYTIEIQRL